MVPLGGLLHLISGDKPAPSHVAETGNLDWSTDAGTESEKSVVETLLSIRFMEVALFMVDLSKITLSNLRSLDQISAAFELQLISK